MDAVHQISSLYAWHGRLMVLAWSVLLPAGILTARFLKVMPAQDWPRQLDNQVWWHAHRTLQISGIACMSVGVALAWKATGALIMGHSLHAGMGWIIVLLGWLQLLGGYLRGSKGGPTGQRERGDHFDMTPRRLVFEWTHKLGGYVAVILSPVVTALGLHVADAPLWMWIILGIWWTMLVAIALLLQHSGRCLDTYQAIWGPDPALPGNMRNIIGWGVRRYTADGFKRQFRGKHT
jgi:hypothetical protein